MPNWKKVVISGSNAELNEITSSAGIFINAPADGDPIFTVSGSNGQLLRVHDSASSTLFEVNDFSGISHFEVSGSGTLLAKNLEYKNEDFFLSYDSASGRIHFFSSSEFMPDGTISSSAQVNGASLGSNNTVSYGGIQLTLGGTDATPAFNLSDATAYPGDSSLVTLGTVTTGDVSGILPDGTVSGSSQISLSGFDTDDLSEGSTNRYYTTARVKTKLDNEGVLSGSSQVDGANITNNTVNFGGVSVALGSSDTTPAFALADATGLPIGDGTTGTLPVNRGGTGVTTLSSGQVLIGNGTADVSTTAIGISNGNIVKIDSTTVADNEYARFTANGLESRTAAEVASDMGAITDADGVFSASAQIDHDQLTNFAANEHFTQGDITTVGTVTSGDVSGILPDGTVSGSSQVNGASITNNAITIAGTSTALNGSISAATILNGTGVVSGSTGDDLGNHTATQALDMAGFDVSDAGTITGTKLIVGNSGIEHVSDDNTKITFAATKLILRQVVLTL